MYIENSRIKLGYKLNKENAYLFKDAISHLKTQNFNPDDEYFEFLISGIALPDELQSSLELFYEIGITEENNALILTTLATDGDSHELDHEHRLRLNHSKLWLHTHRIKKGKPIVTVPSFTDIYASSFIDDSTILALAHGEGMMNYRKPCIDPRT